MSIGAGIFLLVVGAILSFGVQDRWDVIDLTVIGYIMMGAGVLGILLGVILSTRRRGVTSTTRSSVDPVTGEGVSQHERTIS